MAWERLCFCRSKVLHFLSPKLFFYFNTNKYFGLQSFSAAKIFLEWPMPLHISPFKWYKLCKWRDLLWIPIYFSILSASQHLSITFLGSTFIYLEALHQTRIGMLINIYHLTLLRGCELKIFVFWGGGEDHCTKPHRSMQQILNKYYFGGLLEIFRTPCRGFEPKIFCRWGIRRPLYIQIYQATCVNTTKFLKCIFWGLKRSCIHTVEYYVEPKTFCWWGIVEDYKLHKANRVITRNIQII
jgi:hypothetical protein